MDLGMNLVKDLTPLINGSPAVMLMSQIGGATVGSDSFMSMLGEMSSTNAAQNQQTLYGSFQPNQSGQTNSAMQQVQPPFQQQVGQTASAQSNNQQIAQTQSQTNSQSKNQAQSNTDVKQPAGAQNNTAKTQDKTNGSGANSSTNAANKDSNGTTSSVGDKNKVKDQTAATTTDPTNVAGVLSQQVMTMADLLKTLNLNADQIAKIATALNVTPDQLGKIQVVVGNNSQANNTGLMDASKLISKVAEVLNLSKAQTDSLFNALNISSVDVKSVIPPVVGGNSPASPMQITPTNQALAAQVTAGEVKPIVQQDLGGNNFGFGTQTGSNTAATTPQTNSVSAGGGFNAVLNAASANGNQVQAVSSAATAQTVSTVATAQEHANSAIMGQIMEKASILSLPNATETKISLSPEKLGTVDIKLTMTDSNVSAAIVVGSDAVKQVVEKNLDQLKLALNQQGIMVSQMNVSVGQQGNQSFGNGLLNGSNSNGGTGFNGGNVVAPVEVSAMKQSNVWGRTGRVLVDLTA